MIAGGYSHTRTAVPPPSGTSAGTTEPMAGASLVKSRCSWSRRSSDPHISCVGYACCMECFGYGQEDVVGKGVFVLEL